MSFQERPENDSTGVWLDHVPDRRGTESVKWNRYGEDVLPLWVADMDFPSPPGVIDALRRRVEHGIFGYGVEPAELRDVIHERFQRLYGWQVGWDDFIFVPGVVVGFNLACRSFGDPGDGVLIQTPVYPPFFGVAKNGNRVLNQVPLVQGPDRFEIDFDAFERAITRRTRVFLLCNPHNPVGRVFTKAELERLADICLRHDLIICSDEIHQDFVYPGHHHIPIASLAPEVAACTVTVTSPSKSYNIAGFSFAMVLAGNPDLRERMKATAAGLITHPGILDYLAGLTAYKEGGRWLDKVLGHLKSNRDLLVSYVREKLPGITMAEPEGTYLGWLDCRGAGIEGSPAEFFLKESRVALNEGATFGEEGKGFVRLNFGCPRSILEEALDRMSKALAAR